MTRKTRRRRTGQTVHEFLAELEQDPVYQARAKARDEAMEREGEVLRAAEAPLVRDLNAVGVRVSSVWDLVNSSEPYPAAIPILFAHLPEPYPLRIREGIARALAVPEARSGWDLLVSMFEADSDRSANGLKWAIGCALAGASDETVLDQVIELVHDRRHGDNRAALFFALEKSKRPSARAALLALTRDPELSQAARQSLRGKFD